MSGAVRWATIGHAAHTEWRLSRGFYENPGELLWSSHPQLPSMILMAQMARAILDGQLVARGDEETTTRRSSVMTTTKNEVPNQKQFQELHSILCAA
jgi:hypothetical protein